MLKLFICKTKRCISIALATKAEFDSLKNNFQAQIDSYNSAIDSKIDGAIASYLSGIQMATEFPQIIPWATNGVTFVARPSSARLGWAPPALVYRPFGNSEHTSLFLKYRDAYDDVREQEEMPGFNQTIKNFGRVAKFVIEAIGVPGKGQQVFSPDFINIAKQMHGADWRTWYIAQDLQTKKEFWYDGLTASAFLTYVEGGYSICKGIGRISVAPKISQLVGVFTNDLWSNMRADMPDTWDAAWHELGEDSVRGVNSLASLKLAERKSNYSKKPAFEYLKENGTINVESGIDTESNMMTTYMNIGPVMWTEERLTGTQLDPIDTAEWQESTKGWEGIWTYRIADPKGLRNAPIEYDWATMECNGNGSQTTYSIKKVPYNSCGDLLVNSDYGGAYFDETALWMKEPTIDWLGTELVEWQYGLGPRISSISQINDNTDNNYKFAGVVYYNPEYFGSDRTEGYARPDSHPYDAIGELPVYKITPKESEKVKINDFYAPLYGNDTMSPYGKSYVDGACICKVATDGDNLRVKLKSTEDTTLYFNKNPFTTCDAAGNMGYIANGTPYSAGNGVHVNANEAITIDIKNVLAEDRYYVKPDTATTIQFESAVITQDS